MPPASAGRAGTRQSPPSDFRHRSDSVLSTRNRLVYGGLAVWWVFVNIEFWGFWLGSAGQSTGWLYWPATAALSYQCTALPSFYWFFVGRMRRPREVRPAGDMRVAMITLCVPAMESLGVIEDQLRALRAVQYPHDSWILDEGGDPAVRALAAQVGVNYFSRRGIAAWNRPGAPFQEKTKAGNVNAWLDEVGSRGLGYEVFVQLDVDHHPRADYLDRVLGYFADAQVGWVQAPSVCGNLENWAARGLAEQELVFQGPLQMGFYGHSMTPFIIGSHTTYRMSAIHEIGGFQPTRAEDHLDTIVLAAHGYRGVFVPELIAVGDGPDTFATYLRQQFAWAYSMIGILFSRTPALIRRYSPGQAFQFLMAQGWYTLWSVTMAVLWIVPGVALATDRQIAAVHLARYLLYFLPVPLTGALMWCFTRRWFQPAGVRLSWRGVILEMARWPVVLWALINILLRITRPYMVTPKGLVAERPPNGITLYGPYLALCGLSLGAFWTFRLTVGDGPVQRYELLVLCNVALALGLLVITLMLEVRQLGEAWGSAARAMRARGRILSSVCALGAMLVVSTIVAWGPILGTGLLPVIAGGLGGARPANVIPTELFLREPMLDGLGRLEPVPGLGDLAGAAGR